MMNDNKDYCEYFHNGRTIRVEKFNGGFKETITYANRNKSHSSIYYIVNGRKCYTGAGGGDCEDDNILPTELLRMGKIFDPAFDTFKKDNSNDIIEVDNTFKIVNYNPMVRSCSDKTPIFDEPEDIDLSDCESLYGA